MKMPAEVVEIRGEICGRCATPCAHQKDTEFHRNPCNECPVFPRMWGKYGQCDSFGLGDAVATVAQPIARGLDAVFGTNIQGCGGCAQRRAALNKLVPKL